MSTDPLDSQAVEPPAQPATGLKAKATDVATKAYLKAPPKAQTAILNGYVKAQPAVAKVSRFAKPALVGTSALFVLRKVRGRKG